MPLGDISAFHEWVEREGPSRVIWSIGRTWIAELTDRSYQAPSIPVPEFSRQPESEIRYAELPETGGVVVLYIHHYATEIVDLIYVGQ